MHWLRSVTVAADSSAGGQGCVCCICILNSVLLIVFAFCVLYLCLSFVFCAPAGARYGCSRFKCWWSEGYFLYFVVLVYLCFCILYLVHLQRPDTVAADSSGQRGCAGNAGQPKLSSNHNFSLAFCFFLDALASLKEPFIPDRLSVFSKHISCPFSLA